MADTAATLQKLVNLAVHPGTPAEEARSAALAALKLAAREGWKLTAPAVAPQHGHDVPHVGRTTGVYDNTWRPGDGPDPSRGPAYQAAYEAWSGQPGSRSTEQAVGEAARRERARQQDTAPNKGRPRRGSLRRIASSRYCATCATIIMQGDKAWFEPTFDAFGMRDTRCWHADCSDPPPLHEPSAYHVAHEPHPGPTVRPVGSSGAAAGAATRGRAAPNPSFWLCDVCGLPVTPGQICRMATDTRRSQVGDVTFLDPVERRWHEGCPDPPPLE